MTDDLTKRLSVYLPDIVKYDLERMAAETGLSIGRDALKIIMRGKSLSICSSRSPSS
ncbi:hypothetical protein [Paenibacillus piri]|uniref:hypothetical protein n=1 Tax=Paenibacillus piri TaxID=2547395 RepID=UPI0014045354|nr:hypothetical protein [Paenibacillus piri]